MMKIFALMTVALLMFGAGAVIVAAEDNVSVDENVTDLVEENVTVDENVTEEVVDEVSEEVAEEAGITPDSPLYIFDKLVDRLTLSFTFNERNRAMKTIQIAEERLAEMEIMLVENDTEAAEEAEAEHSDLLDEASEIVEEVEGNGGNETEEALEEIEEIRMRLMSHAEKVASVKTRILQRAEAQGRDPAKLAHMAMVFSRVVDKSREVENKAEQKKENVKTRLKVLAELSEEEIAQLEEKLQERVRRKIANAMAGEDAEEEEVEDESEEESEEETETEENSTEPEGNATQTGQ